MNFMIEISQFWREKKNHDLYTYNHSTIRMKKKYLRNTLGAA